MIHGLISSIWRRENGMNKDVAPLFREIGVMAKNLKLDATTEEVARFAQDNNLR